MAEKICSEREKIDFLEQVLGVAERHKDLIAKEKSRGKLIYVYSFLDETGFIAVHLDREDKLFFKVRGDFSTPSEIETNSAEEAVRTAARYLPHKLSDFKSEFHFYEDADGRVDLLDEIRSEK